MRAGSAAMVAAALPLVATGGNAVVGSAEVAAADPLGSELPWTAYPAVGYCGNTSGNVVRWWQTILWADGWLSGTEQVDGIFGPNTKSATKAWQTQHNQTVDGCAGYFSYQHAQGHLDFIGNEPVLCCPHSEWKYSGRAHGVVYSWAEPTDASPRWTVQWNPPFHI